VRCKIHAGAAASDSPLSSGNFDPGFVRKTLILNIFINTIRSG